MDQCVEANRAWENITYRAKCQRCNYSLQMENREACLYTAGQPQGEDLFSRHRIHGNQPNHLDLEAPYSIEDINETFRWIKNSLYQEQTGAPGDLNGSGNLTDEQYELASFQEMLVEQQQREQASIRAQQAAVRNLQSLEAGLGGTDNPYMGRYDEQYIPGEFESPLAAMPQDPVHAYHDPDAAVTVGNAAPFDDVMESAGSGGLPDVVWHNNAGVVGGDRDYLAETINDIMTFGLVEKTSLGEIEGPNLPMENLTGDLEYDGESMHF